MRTRETFVPATGEVLHKSVTFTSAEWVEYQRILNSHAALVEALHNVMDAATGTVNGRNVTSETRRLECAVIARAALALVEKEGA